MTIQEDAVAAIEAVDAKIEDVVTVLDTHTQALADVRKALDDALKAQDLSALAAGLVKLKEHTDSLAAAADRMRAGDPPAVAPAPAPQE